MGILRLASMPPGSATVMVEPSLPLRLSLTETVASVTRLRSTQMVLVSTQLPIAMTSDWEVMSWTDSATARLVSAIGRVFWGGASTAVAQRDETSRAITISKQLSRVIFFMLEVLSLLSFSLKSNGPVERAWEWRSRDPKNFPHMLAVEARRARRR